MSVKHEINLSLRTPNVSRLRAVAGSEENLSHYYQLLQQIVNDHHIDVSTSIGNLDETFDLKSRKVIAERNARTVYQLSCLTGEQLEHITIVAFVCSDGHSFPPLFIFKGNGCVPRTIISAVKQFDGNAQVCVTPNGWIDDSSFVRCLTIFLRQLRERQPLNSMDGFSCALMDMVATSNYRSCKIVLRRQSGINSLPSSLQPHTSATGPKLLQCS